MNRLLSSSRNINKAKLCLAKSRGEWESIKTFPRDFAEEHEELTADDYVNEVFDDDYYHYFHKEASSINDEALEDHFYKQRIWYHWYIHPEQFSTEYEYGNVVVKTLFRLLPVLAFIFLFYIKPNIYRQQYGKKYPISRPIIL